VRTYAVHQVSSLLKITVAELHNTAGGRDAEAIHRLRVSIRRLLQALKTFAQYLPKEARDGVEEELRTVIKAAGRARDCDVLLETLADSDVALDAFHRQRTELTRELQAAIQPLLGKNLSRRWRNGLGIPAK
jgi:triphosphatase